MRAFFMGILSACLASLYLLVISRREKGEDCVFTSSHCEFCGHRLSLWEMVPVVSYLLSGGKCLFCGRKLSINYLLIEIMGFMAGYISEDFAEFFLLNVLVIICIYDLLFQQIPLFWLMGAVVLSLNVGISLSPEERVITAVLYVLPVMIINRFNYGLGGADIILLGCLSVGYGSHTVCIATLSGSIAAFVFMKKYACKRVAFCPFLTAGLLVSKVLSELSFFV